MIVESLAFGAFKTLVKSAVEPLLLATPTSVVQKEARHGVSGGGAYEFRDRSGTFRRFRRDVGRVMDDGVFPRVVFESEQRRLFRMDLFSVMLPGLRDIGLFVDRTKQEYVTLGIDVDAI